MSSAKYLANQPSREQHLCGSCACSCSKNVVDPILPAHALVRNTLLFIAGTEAAEYIRINDFYLPPRFLRLYDGPALAIEGAWRVLGLRRIKVAYQSGAVADSGMKSQLGVKPVGYPCSKYWQGDLQNSLLGQTECIPEVVESMEACMKKAGPGKVATDDSLMIDRGKYLVSQFKALCRSFAVLAESYVAEKATTTDIDQSQCGYTAFVHATISQVIATVCSMTESNISESKADEADDADLTSEQLDLVIKDAGRPPRQPKFEAIEARISALEVLACLTSLVCRTRPTPRRTLMTCRESAGTRLEGVLADAPRVVWCLQLGAF